MQNTEQNLQALTWQQSQFWPHSLYHMQGLELLEDKEIQLLIKVFAFLPVAASWIIVLGAVEV